MYYKRTMLDKFIRFILSLSLVCYSVVPIPSRGSDKESVFPNPTSKDNFFSEKHPVLEAQEFNQSVESLKDKIFAPPLEGTYENHPLDVYSLLGQRVENTVPSPHSVSYQKIMVEVLNAQNQVQAIVSASNFVEAVKYILPKEQQPLYSQNKWVTQDKELHTFRITHQGRVLHIFSNNIQWISFIGSYLVFMEPSQVYKDNKVFISFIDLKYFEQALGKTALPIFRVPVSTKFRPKELFLYPMTLRIDRQFFSSSSKEKDTQDKLTHPFDLLHGESITHSKTSLRQGEVTLSLNGNNGAGGKYTLTEKDMDYLSRFQQLAFNIMVSLVNVDRYENDFYPFVKEIIQNFKESAKQNAPIPVSRMEVDRSGQELVDLLVQTIQQRVETGPHQDTTGHYGHLKQIQIELKSFSQESGDPRGLYKTFTEHLKNDEAFQKMLSNVGNEKFTKKKFFNRLQGLFLQLTKPEPLGAPKIQEALGLIAGSLHPRDNLQNQFFMFKEGVSRILANKKVRVIGSPILAGAFYFAHPSVAEFYHHIFSWGADWLYKWADLATTTLSTGGSGFNPWKLYDNYIAEGRYQFLAVGVGALFMFTYGAFGALHIIMHTKDFIQYIKSHEFVSRRPQVENLITRWKEELRALSAQYVDFANKNKHGFLQNLANREWRKIGLKTQFIFPFMDKPIFAFFKTQHIWTTLLENYKNPATHVDIVITVDNIPVVELSSFLPEQIPENGYSMVTVEFHPPGNKALVRQFILKDAEKIHALFVEKGSVQLKDNIAITVRGYNKNSDKKFIINGQLIDGNFTMEEEQLIETTLNEIQKEREKLSYVQKIFSAVWKKNKMFDQLFLQSEGFSVKEYTGFFQALRRMLSYANWTYTMQNVIYWWNEGFKGRNYVLRPSAGIRAMYYKNYFDRVVTQDHIPTVFNGGYEPRFQVTNKTLPANVSTSEYLQAMHDFEEKIMDVERKYLQASSEQALLDGIIQFGKEGMASDMAEMLSRGVKTNPEDFDRFYIPEDQKTKVSVSLLGMKNKNKFFMELYIRELFNESIRSEIKQELQLPNSVSDSEVKHHIIEKIMSGEDIALLTQDMAQIRKRVRTTTREQKIKDRVRGATSRILSFTNIIQKNRLKAERLILPDRSAIMQVYSTGKKQLKDPEAMARVTRYQLAKIMVDKPIELVFLFIIMAGVDQGVLKILHEEGFSDNAFFHLSRVAVWTIFFKKLVVDDILGGAWMKLIMDARLGMEDNFSDIPSKKDVSKKFATVRGFKKGFWDAEDNAFSKNYKYVWKIGYANIGATFVLYGIIHLFSLGRFDADLFLNIYLIEVFGVLALLFKTENAFEKMANYSLKDLIKKGFNFNKEHKHLLAHPRVQQFRMIEANKLRRRFNIINAVLYNNLIENMSQLFANIDTQHGTRFFQRQFLFGSTITEYWVSFMDKLESIGVPAKVTNACKIVFTNNRTDLMK